MTFLYRHKVHLLLTKDNGETFEVESPLKFPSSGPTAVAVDLDAVDRAIQRHYESKPKCCCCTCCPRRRTGGALTV